MTTRRWLTAEAVVLPARAAPADLVAAERYPFPRALVEGPGALRVPDLIEAAVAAGTSRAAIGGDPATAARAVREGIERGQLLALRRRPSPSPVQRGRVDIEGSFTEQDTYAPTERHRLGWDAETEYVVPWRGAWATPDRIGGRVRATLNMMFTREALITKYFGTARPSSPHDRDGTLGAHERRHRELARQWWSSETLNELVRTERIALELVLPPGLSRPELDERCGRQMDAIAAFITAKHQGLQEATLDHLGGETPSFAGIRR
jgi:hypothetical protein